MALQNTLHTYPLERERERESLAHLVYVHMPSNAQGRLLNCIPWLRRCRKASISRCTSRDATSSLQVPTKTWPRESAANEHSVIDSEEDTTTPKHSNTSSRALPAYAMPEF